MILAVQKLARSLGCDYALFDGDASVIDELPVFEDEDQPPATAQDPR